MNWTKMTPSLAIVAAGLILGTTATVAAGQAPKSSSEKDWWKNAVIYEIYPRSFQDSNGDGIGDLNGITSRLDYLKKLGVDAIWLTPCYPSPQVDFGYDISDYKNIDPQYGTLADFDRLVAEASKRHIRIIMDMVMNHTSDKHEWFQQAISSRSNPYHDWYVFHEGKGQTATDKGLPPNNWQSLFGHSGWQWNEKTREYYYHKFYIEQPDVNWDNPKIHQAFKDIASFWLKRGVAGFRFDAITTLYEDPNLTDEGIVKDKDGKDVINAYGDPQLDNSKTDNLPGVHPVMAEMRAHFDAESTAAFPGTRVMIGETYLPNIGELAKQYGSKEKPEFELPMDTQILSVNKMDAATFRTKLSEAENGLNGNVPLVLFDNHDNPRIDARYGDGKNDVAIQRVLSTVLLATHGASMFYYGDELGMKTTPPTRVEDVKDPIGKIGWPQIKGRDGERTPMQWDASTNSGFSKTTPWLPVPPTAATVNVKAEEADATSLLNWFEKLIAMKKTMPVMATGAEKMLDESNPSVLSWVRTLAGHKSVVVAANFTDKPQTVSLKVEGSDKVKSLLHSPEGSDATSISKIDLPAYGVFVGELQ